MDERRTQIYRHRTTTTFLQEFINIICVPTIYITCGIIIYIPLADIHNNVHVTSFHRENFEMSVLLRECIQYNIVAFIHYFFA